MTTTNQRAVEVRNNDDGTLDEIVGVGQFHLEQMHDGCWSVGLGPHMVTLNAKGKIKALVELNAYREQTPTPGWRPISEAPRDGSPVLLLTRRDAHERFGDLQFVGRNNGDSSLWGFAAPVGCAGFPDHWFVGWMPLTESKTKEET